MERKTKSISEMSEREILRRQLELLAEESVGASSEELARLSTAMVEIYRGLAAAR